MENKKSCIGCGLRVTWRKGKNAMDSNGEMKDKVSRNKTKSKKKPLCRLSHLVQRRTRVGCLSSEVEDINLSDHTYSSGGRKMEQANAERSHVLPGQEHRVGTWDKTNKTNEKCVDELVRSLSPKEASNSTKITLCCAMTESSKSVDHHNSNYHRTNSGERNKMSHGDFTDGKNTANFSCPKFKPQAVSLECETAQYDRCAFGGSIDKEEPEPACVTKESDVIQSSSPSVSDMSSCESSPIPGQGRLRGSNLVQRRSVDNLLLGLHQSPPLRHSSPDSSKSIPQTQRRYKTRSVSHDTMLPPRDKALVRVEERDVNKGRGSMDSLARHSLLAAQVFHLIPTVKARERNFLHGRIAADSLLGSLELEKTLPQRELRVFVGTWNMNGQAPPKELNDFMLPSGLEHVPDVIVVGTQESYSERFEWEVHIQETVGPSHLLFHSAALGTLHLAVYLRRDLLWFCSMPEDSSYSVRPGTAFRTKGAVAIAFMLFGTSFLFITAHLTAHVDKVKERIHDIRRIVKSLDLPKVLPVRHKNKDVTQNFDYVFWCGDLNFRLTQSREEVIQWVSKQQFPLVRPHMLCSDQLRASRAQGSVFRDFDEGPITFPPTYKYDPGTQNYDTSHKQRTPSYTDRILFKSGRGRRDSHMLGGTPTLQCLVYTSVPSICTSDHKPVWGLYRCTVRPGIDTIPLAAGLFNREVYLEGINRRAAALDKKQPSSGACSLQ